MSSSLAPAPSRSTASFSIGWGILNIPVAVYGATEATGVARREFTVDGHEVGRISIDKETNDVLARDEVLRMAQATNGAWVELTDDEVVAVTAPSSRCEVVTFVPLAAIGSVYLPEKHYMVRPRREKGRLDPNVEAGFALLLTAMAHRQVAALIKVTMRGPARYAAVLPDGRMVTLHYAEGVRDALPFPQVDLPEKSVALAEQLIDAVGTDLPTLRDDNGAAIQAFVDGKAAGMPNPPPTQAAPLPTFDILGALEAAVTEATKGKPRKSPAKAAPAKRTRKTAA